MKVKAKPLRTEKIPNPVIFWVQPHGSYLYPVKDKDTWGSVAKKFNVQPGRYFKGNSAQYLIWYNFSTNNTDEVNWYLREFVGCNVSTDGGNNWAFSSSADPGIIYIPPQIINVDEEGEALEIEGSRGLNGKNVITVPQYDDSNFLDTLSKALDVLQMVELFQTLEITIPMLVEGGLIAVGIIGMVGPAVAVAAPHADALRTTSRKHFFEGFSAGLVMSANGASERYIRTHREMHTPPFNNVYREKGETFRKLHNAGLMLGIKKGKQFNLPDKESFFIYLHSKLRGSDRQYYTGRWKDWSDNKKTQYYDLLSAFVRETMISKKLQLKIK